MSKAVMISIRPEWCEKIANGEKSIEVRKTRPKLNTPFKCYIYCTNGNLSYPVGNGMVCHLNGGRAVIGEFVCDRVFPIRVFPNGTIQDYMFNDLEKACVPYDDIVNYIGNGCTGYGWHISDLVIYDKPKLLWEFMKCGARAEKELDEELCSYCEQTEWGERRYCGTPNGPVMCEGMFCGEAYDLYLDANFALKRPPQSWCYVEG